MREYLAVSFTFVIPKALIETLSEDRASVMQEKKHLEEELNRLRSTVLASSSMFTSAEAGAAAARALPVAETLADTSVGAMQDDEHVDSAVEASMVTVQ